jgi:1,4-alpha-glucan branching enzyme
MGWMNDFTRYLKCDPYFRNYNYGDLTFSMLYAYSEKFVLVFSHDEVVHGKCSMLCKMPGVTYEEKANNLRAAYGFMYGHPGKKLLFMGQEFAQVSEWNEAEELPWNILKYPVHKSTQDYVKALNKLYLTQPAMYKKDDEPEGFQWINCSDRENNIVSFVRKTDKPEETLLFICNFAPVEHEKYQLGVPFYGKYKEILNSDSKEFGGRGKGNPRAITSKQIECDEHANSITIDLPPMSTVIFSCTPTAEPKKKAPAEKKTATEKKADAKITAAKKTTKAAKTAVAEETAPVVEVKAEAAAPAEKKTTAKKAPAAKKTSAPKKAAAKKAAEEK